MQRHHNKCCQGFHSIKISMIHVKVIRCPILTILRLAWWWHFFFCVAIFMTSASKYANCVLRLLTYPWIAFGAKFVAKIPLFLVFLALLCPWCINGFGLTWLQLHVQLKRMLLIVIVFITLNTMLCIIIFPLAFFRAFFLGVIPTKNPTCHMLLS